MLTSFVSTTTFNLLRVTMVVDCVQQDAQVTLTYNRRLRDFRDVPYHEVQTPAAAEAYLRRPSAIGEL